MTQTHALKPLACALADGRVAVYIGSAYQYLPQDKALVLLGQLCQAIGEHDTANNSRLEHAVHAYKVACVARMAMETDPEGTPSVAVLDASIREGVRAALAAVGATPNPTGVTP